MRAFIAIDLTDNARDSLKRLQDRMKTAGADVKWVEPQNIHLTLKFLGEISDEQCRAVAALMDDRAKKTRAFLAEFDSVGAFPRIQSPRILWAGISAGAQECGALAKTLEEKIEKLGIPREERAFSAHITMGRTRSADGRGQLVQALQSLKDYFAETPLSMEVAHMTLFKSTLTPRGPLYEVIVQTSLATI